MGRSLPSSSRESLESPGFKGRCLPRWTRAAGLCPQQHGEARPRPGEGEVHKMAREPTFFPGEVSPEGI